jgi:hypothetical protein
MSTSVKWTGCLDADATWEQVKDFNTDNLFLGKKGNVVDSFLGR